MPSTNAAAATFVVRHVDALSVIQKSAQSRRASRSVGRSPPSDAAPSADRRPTSMRQARRTGSKWLGSPASAHRGQRRPEPALRPGRWRPRRPRRTRRSSRRGGSSMAGHRGHVRADARLTMTGAEPVTRSSASPWRSSADGSSWSGSRTPSPSCSSPRSCRSSCDSGCHRDAATAAARRGVRSARGGLRQLLGTGRDGRARDRSRPRAECACDRHACDSPDGVTSHRSSAARRDALATDRQPRAH